MFKKKKKNEQFYKLKKSENIFWMCIQRKNNTPKAIFCLSTSSTNYVLYASLPLFIYYKAFQITLQRNEWQSFL